MNSATDPRWAASPRLHGLVVGFGFPFLVVALPIMWGRLDALLTGLRVYALLPVFVVCGGLSVASARFLYPTYRRLGLRATGLALGCLIGGCVLGAALLWGATGDRPWPNRIVLSVFGAPLLVGFWQWIGALLGLAAAQQGEERALGAVRPQP